MAGYHIPHDIIPKQGAADAFGGEMCLVFFRNGTMGKVTSANAPAHGATTAFARVDDPFLSSGRGALDLLNRRWRSSADACRS